eukprot:scaffold248537_cov18-Tisochrysis_lutea.AAC.1
MLYVPSKAQNPARFVGVWPMRKAALPLAKQLLSCSSTLCHVLNLLHKTEPPLQLALSRAYVPELASWTCRKLLQPRLQEVKSTVKWLAKACMPC